MLYGIVIRNKKFLSKLKLLAMLYTVTAKERWCVGEGQFEHVFRALGCSNTVKVTELWQHAAFLLVLLKALRKQIYCPSRVLLYKPNRQHPHKRASACALTGVICSRLHTFPSYLGRWANRFPKTLTCHEEDNHRVSYRKSFPSQKWNEILVISDIFLWGLRCERETAGEFGDKT